MSLNSLAELDMPVVFRCSGAAGYVIGKVLAIDGGYTAK
jgi:hypothetical protein